MALSYQPSSFLRKNIFKFDSRVFATVKNTRSIISSPASEGKKSGQEKSPDSMYDFFKLLWYAFLYYRNTTYL